MNEETLIRQAIAEEADQAVDPGTVLAGLREARPRRRTGMLMAVAAAAVVAAVVAVVIPLTSSRDSNGPAGPPATTKPPAPPAAEQTILLAGFDGNWYTDTVILLHRRANGSYDAVSLPRDTLVRVPGRGDTKLNTAYLLAAANNDAGFQPAGAKALVDTVQELTRTHVDHYAMVDMNVFGKLAEAVGGVEVCLRTKVKDAFSGADLPAGRQVLTGGQALAFLRQRHGLPNSDLDRIVRQQAFLRSLIVKLAAHKDFTQLLGTVKDTVWTDPGWDLLQFANEVAQGADARSATIPYTDAAKNTPNNGAVIAVDPAAVARFVGEFFTAQPTGTAQPGAPGDTCVN